MSTNVRLQYVTLLSLTEARRYYDLVQSMHVYNPAAGYYCGKTLLSLLRPGSAASRAVAEHPRLPLLFPIVIPF
jgi:hypothetical protein